jgi:hypothetical protein
MLDFVKAMVFDPADFTIRSDGVVRLNSQLARCVAQILASLSPNLSPNKTRRPTVALALPAAIVLRRREAASK